MSWYGLPASILQRHPLNRFKQMWTAKKIRLQCQQWKSFRAMPGACRMSRVDHIPWLGHLWSVTTEPCDIQVWSGAGGHPNGWNSTCSVKCSIFPEIRYYFVWFIYYSRSHFLRVLQVIVMVAMPGVPAADVQCHLRSLEIAVRRRLVALNWKTIGKP